MSIRRWKTAKKSLDPKGTELQCKKILNYN